MRAPEPTGPVLPQATPGHPLGRRRRLVHHIVAALVLGGLLLPLLYTAQLGWAHSRATSAMLDRQATGASYLRPLVSLLDTLVEAQCAAVQGTAVDIEGVRSAIGRVNAADQRSGDLLSIGQRWSQIPARIEPVLISRIAGRDAVAAYAGPIGLVQSLLTELGDVATIADDHELGAHRLIDTAVIQVPEAMVNAAQMSNLARTDSRVGREVPPDPRIALAQDRIDRAVLAIGAGLRNGTSEAAGTGLAALKPLDEFNAATNAMIHADLTELGSVSAQASLEATRRQAHRAAVALDASLLDTYDSMLLSQISDLSGRHRTLLLATVLAGLATLVAIVLVLRTELINRPSFRPVAPRRPAADNVGSASTRPAPANAAQASPFTFLAKPGGADPGRSPVGPEYATATTGPAGPELANSGPHWAGGGSWEGPGAR